MTTDKLLVKKLTLKAWTKILLNAEKIDINKYNKMISAIDKLNS